MLSATLVIWGFSTGAIIFSFLYFRYYQIQRPPIGVMNLRDLVIMLGGIVIIPILYSLLPNFMVAIMLILGGTSIIFFLIDGIFHKKWLTWLLTMMILLVDLTLFWNFGNNSNEFIIVNNTIQILVVVGITNLWAQSGLKARDTAIFSFFLICYDFLFTNIFSFMADLFDLLSLFPFSPMVIMKSGSEDSWLAIGLGDLLIAAVFPLVMRKSYGNTPGNLAILVSIISLGAILVSPQFNLFEEIFPVMVLLGPLVIIQYLFWAYRKGRERTTQEYMADDKSIRA